MENLSTNTEHRGGSIRSSDEGACNDPWWCFARAKPACIFNNRCSAKGWNCPVNVYQPTVDQEERVDENKTF